MNRAKLAAVVLFVGIFFGFAGCAPARALDVTTTTTTPDEYWLKDTELKISAYRRTSADIGNDLHYLELFNDSDHLLDISNWKITGVFGATNSRYELPLVAQSSGRIRPKGHVTVQVVSSVSGASFTALPWQDRPAGDISVLNSLEVSARAVGWKTDVYVLKSTTKTIVDPVTKKSSTVPVYDDFWVRAQISGESYTSTLSSFAVAPVQLLDDGLYEAPANADGIRIIEIYPYSSDCAPNDETVLCGDYIKLHVDKNVQDLSNYVVRTDSSSSSRTTSNTFYLADYPITDDGYITLTADSTGKRISLTNSGGYVWLEDLYGGTLYELTMMKYESASSNHQGWSYMLDESDAVWKWTSTPEPNLVNVLTIPVEPVEVVECPAGKYLNPDTGRCRTIEEAVNALAACPEGQERNPLTNRCRSKVLATTSTLVPCGEGQERNPTTNRCRSIASAVAELIPCDEGYERNPATNRCRKVLGVATGAAATNPAQVVEQAKGSDWNTWTWALVAVGATGAIGYGIYEWRHELRGAGQKVVAKFAKK